MFNSFPLLIGSPGATGTSGSSGNYIQILLIVGVFAIFYLLIIRPQRKKQKDTKKMLEAVKKGDRVSSIGGIRGTVKNVSETTVIIEVDKKGTTLEFTKSAIASVEPVSTESAPPRKTKEPEVDDASESSEQK